jgi:hypothetical protein
MLSRSIAVVLSLCFPDLPRVLREESQDYSFITCISTLTVSSLFYLFFFHSLTDLTVFSQLSNRDPFMLELVIHRACRMVRARHRQPPVRFPSPPPRRHLGPRMSTMPRPPKPKKRPPHWRKPEDVELSEEVRDLKRDIALHSEADSGAKNDQTHAPDKHPGTQEHNKAGTERPKDNVNDFGWESLECGIVSPNISARGIRALNRAGRCIAPLDAPQAQAKPNPAKKPSGMTSLHQISFHGTRTLNRAGGRFAWPDVAQALTTQGKIKKAARLHFGILSC